MMLKPHEHFFHTAQQQAAVPLIRKTLIPGAPFCHTSFYFLYCRCGGVAPFPPENYKLLSQEMRVEIESNLEAQGYHLLSEEVSA